MRPLDWLVLVGSLVFIVAYGLWKGRRSRDLDGYLLGGRGMRWPTVALAIMATQASAITFLSTPGQAYADGMRFVQFYFGLPVAMVVLCVTAVGIYHRLKVYTAYEYLERRFDLKTRTLAGFLFLIQRGLACGLTIYAPSLILSTLMGWNIYWTNFVIGSLVVIYTAAGGTKAVNHTNFQQMLIILIGMGAAFVVLITSLPPDVSFFDATYVAGKMGRLNAIDFSFDWTNRYNFWSGLIGGFFLALSYFGTDQSQVQRYLAGQSIAQSRLALLFNGLMKVPMQFLILFVGAMVFAFYQFVTPPLLFNSVAAETLRRGPAATEYHRLEAEYQQSSAAKQHEIRSLLSARNRGDRGALIASEQRIEQLTAQTEQIRQRTFQTLQRTNPRAESSDTNYVFLNFVLRYLPAGLLGLVLAAVFAASMSSTAAELNALASTTVVDVYRRLLRPAATEQHYVAFSKIATVIWGAFAIGFANFATRLGTLVEAVNILGSLFYGTILGIFLLAFYFKRVGGTAAFTGAIVAEALVVYCFRYTTISFLWYNVVGCLAVIAAALVLTGVQGGLALTPQYQRAGQRPEDSTQDPE
jgi:SSS family solute:Na+ symporter